MSTSGPRDPEEKFTACCRCNGHIDESATDPCFIRVETKTGAWQMWTCHGDCFKKCLAQPPDWPDSFSLCTSDEFRVKRKAASSAAACSASSLH